MLKKSRLILFLLLASVFCFDEIVSIKLLGGDYVYCAEDLGEDGPENNRENNSNEEKQVDDLFIDNSDHQFITTLLYCYFHKSYSEDLLTNPYSEIQLPPPELI